MRAKPATVQIDIGEPWFDGQELRNVRYVIWDKENGVVAQHLASGRGTMEHILELAVEALKTAKEEQNDLQAIHRAKAPAKGQAWSQKDGFRG